MKKYVKLSESDLNEIVNKVIEEEQRIIKGWDIKNNLDFQRFLSKGVTPYYFDTTKDGDYKMVEITKPLSDDMKKIRIFLLKPNELETINKFISNLNELTLMYLEKIKLFKEYIPSLLADKIMK